MHSARALLDWLPPSVHTASLLTEDINPVFMDERWVGPSERDLEGTGKQFVVLSCLFVL
jgi:hypothetical protein